MMDQKELWMSGWKFFVREPEATIESFFRNSMSFSAVVDDKFLVRNVPIPCEPNEECEYK